MAPSRADVHAMVAALFTLTAGMERARRQRKAAGTLSLLQLVADRQPIRPSEIAEVQDVHPSLVTRQVRELEDAGHVRVAADPADGRSCLVTLTPAGTGELHRLTQVGLDRFALFVADWSPGDVRMLTTLLDKLRNSITAVAEQEQEQRPPAVAGQAPPDSTSGTGCLAPKRRCRSPGAPSPARQNFCSRAALAATRIGPDWRHIGGSFAGQAVPLMASRTRDWPVADCRAWRLARKTDIITIDM